MNKMQDHPGFLGFTLSGDILIHADWPAYAVERGWKYALLSLGQFPPGTKFYLRDDIDQCFLLSVDKKYPIDDHSADSRFHVAVWQEDALALLRQAFVIGVSQITHREWAMRRAKELEGAFWQRPDGTVVAFEPPNADDFTDDEAAHGLISNDGLSVTQEGHRALEEMLNSERSDIAPEIMQRARGLILTRHYDAAVREACVLVETLIRGAIGGDLYGLDLVDEFFNQAAISRRFVQARLKVLRTETRALFKFVRNEYSHSLRDIPQTQCYAILVRVSLVFTSLKEIAGVMQPSKK